MHQCNSVTFLLLKIYTTVLLPKSFQVVAINVTLKMYNNTITKQGDNLMTKKEIISMIIDELTENALEEHRKKLAKQGRDYNKELIALSYKFDNILKELPDEKADIINCYINKTYAAAERDCKFLYIKGAKDCVSLLKELGVL